MKKKAITNMTASLLYIILAAGPVYGLTIYDIQYTESVSGDSDYVNQIVDCSGGVVVDIRDNSIVLYNADYSSGWGGIVVKNTTGAFSDAEVGQYYSFSGVMVEESSGNTQLFYDVNGGSTMTLISSNNPIPDPIAISTPSFSEAYESMLVSVSDAAVGAIDQGYYGDNYELINANGTYWAADVFNEDAIDYAEGSFHPLVASGDPLTSTGNTFDSVCGILEHKIKSKNDIDWNYYQLLTMDTNSFMVPEPASMGLFLLGWGLLAGTKRKK